MVCQNILVLRSQDAKIINANRNDMVFDKNKEFNLNPRKKYKIRLVLSIIPVVNGANAIDAEYIEVRCSLGRPTITDNKENPSVGILINQSITSAVGNMIGADTRQLYNFSWSSQSIDLDRIHIQYFDLRQQTPLTMNGGALEHSILYFCFSEIDE